MFLLTEIAPTVIFIMNTKRKDQNVSAGYEYDDFSDKINNKSKKKF